MQARSMNCRSMLQAMTGSCSSSSGTVSTGLSGLPLVRSRSTSSCNGVSQCFGSPSNTIAVHQSQQTIGDQFMLAVSSVHCTFLPRDAMLARY